MIGCRRRQQTILLILVVSANIYRPKTCVDAAVPRRTSSSSAPQTIGRRTQPSSSLTDCESLSFLFRDWQPKSKRVPISEQPLAIETHVGQVSRYFSGVLLNHSDNDQTTMIHVPKLLDACTQFADAMAKVDQRQSARDMRQNIRKVQTYGSRDITSMRELLAHEKMHSQLHQYDHDETLIRLGEHSCAIGLLWIRRSLEFQYTLFQELLNGNEAAVQTAYQQTLLHYHGWGLQKIYAVALKATSGTVSATTAQLGGFDPKHMTQEEYQATLRDLQGIMELWKPLLLRWNQIYDELNLQDLRKV